MVLVLHTVVFVCASVTRCVGAPCRFSLNSELHSHSLVTVISGEEEHFEDFGESNTSDLLLESSVDGSMGKGDATPPEQINGSAVISPR